VLDAAGRRPEAVAVAALAFDEALTLDEDEVVVRAALVHASTWAVGDSPRSASMLEAAASTVGAAPAELLSARSLLAFYRAPVLSRQDRWAAFDALEAEAGHGNEPHLVAQVLIDRRASLVDPDDAEDRLRCGRALMAIAEEVADDHLRLLGTMSAWLAGFELGEMDFDAPELREFCALATARPIRYYPWIAGCAEVLQHIRDGHFDAAAAALAETYELGVGTVGEGDAFPVFAAQQFSLAWAAGDDARVRELIEAAELVSANVDSFVAWDALVALGWFDLGDRDRAVARLAGFGGGPGPRNLAWTTNVAILALCAWAGGDATASEQRYQDLSPYRDRSILSGFGAFVGSGAHFLAYAAAGAGREDEVVPLLRQAQAHHRQLGSRPMALRTELELGARLQHRGEAAGTALLEQVVREAESLGVGSVAARAERALLERPAAAWP